MNFLKVFSTIATILLGKFCPLCLLAWAGVTLGAGSGLLARAVPWGMIALISVGVGTLAWSSCKGHQRIEAICLGVVGGALLYGGRFVWGNDFLIYLGAAALVAAVALDWRYSRRGCPRCQTRAIEKGGEIQWPRNAR